MKSLTTSRDGHQKDRENDVIDEIKLLQQHKARHESRVKVLEDHNRQLQQQLAKLKQLLEQVSIDNCHFLRIIHVVSCAIVIIYLSV